MSKTKCSAEMPSMPLDLPHLMFFKASKMSKGVIVIEFLICLLTSSTTEFLEFFILNTV